MKCPKCDFPRMKTWDELSFEEKFIAERLPAALSFTKEERKRHRFCTRCQYETANENALDC